MTAQTAAISSRNEYLDILEEAWQQHLQPCADNAPTVISTFAGCGGSSLGYSMAGFRELLAVEWDDNAVETFKLNFSGVPVYHGDIAKLSVDECLEMAGLQPGELDVLDGSPPCQGFSTAGKRIMSDDRNQLFREYVRLLRGLKPKVFVMENVSGMVKGKMKLIFAEVMRELKASGYRVSCRLLNAMYFNVPQSRQRLIFIGVRADLDIEPTHPKAERKPLSAIACVAGVNGIPNPYKRRQFNQANRDLKIGKPSPTITKSEVPGSDLPFFNDVRINENQTAIIGSFPSNFIFHGDWKSKIQRIANSVPPLMMRSIARYIREMILAPGRTSHA